MNIWTWSLNFGSSCYLSPCCWRSVHRVQAPWYTSDHPKHCPIQTHTHTHLQSHWCQQLQFAHTLHLGNLINRPFTALLLPYIGLFKRESYHTMNTMCLIFSVKKGEPTLHTRLACLLCGWLQHQCVVVSTSMPTGAAVAALALYNGIWDDTNSPSTHHLMMMAELGQLGPYVVWVWVWVCVCSRGVFDRTFCSVNGGQTTGRKSRRGDSEAGVSSSITFSHSLSFLPFLTASTDGWVSRSFYLARQLGTQSNHGFLKVQLHEIFLTLQVLDQLWISKLPVQHHQHTSS